MENDKAKRTIKGTMLQDFVRLIRSRKDIRWEKYLTKEDLEIVGGKIFAAGWYPMETYRRCGMAVFKEIANEDLEVVRQFGRFTMKNMIDSTYTILKECDDVFDAFEKHNFMNSRFTNFAKPVYEKTGDKSVRMSIMGVDNEEGLEPMCYQALGFADHIIERYGGKNIRVEWEKKMWDGDDGIVAVLIWE